MDKCYRFNGIEHSEETGLDLAFYRSYDPAIGRWMQVDPAAEKYYSMSPYTGIGNNPILLSDPMGDTVRVDGFAQKEVLKWLNQGISVSKKKSPYFFDDDGRLQVDSDKASALSEEKQEVISNIKETTTDEITFTIKKGESETIVASNGGVDVTLGSLGNMATIGDPSNPKSVTIWMTGGNSVPKIGLGDANPREAETGRFLEIGPSFGVYHELGGHGYYRYIKKDPQQAGKSIDYENRVRALWKYKVQPKRAYDSAHPKPKG